MCNLSFEALQISLLATFLLSRCISRGTAIKQCGVLVFKTRGKCSFIRSMKFALGKIPKRPSIKVSVVGTQCTAREKKKKIEKERENGGTTQYKNEASTMSRRKERLCISRTRKAATSICACFTSRVKVCESTSTDRLSITRYFHETSSNLLLKIRNDFTSTCFFAWTQV